MEFYSHIELAASWLFFLIRSLLFFLHSHAVRIFFLSRLFFLNAFAFKMKIKPPRLDSPNNRLNWLNNRREKKMWIFMMIAILQFWRKKNCACNSPHKLILIPGVHNFWCYKINLKQTTPQYHAFLWFRLYTSFDDYFFFVCFLKLAILSGIEQVDAAILPIIRSLFLNSTLWLNMYIHYRFFFFFLF